MAKETTPESENLQAQTRLVRLVEANLKVEVPDQPELDFRQSLLNCATAKIPELKPGFITRLYEAACSVKFPTESVSQFRQKLQFAIGRSLNLKSYRKAP